ncbi:ATP-binding protein [Aquabacterium humicola]|uniref:ATP-binding protein n=1 Tax=Aquabacterium humicola TaxID=3237377 RepID=UPI002543CEB4|nr:ATP-binding protein [Rubrivivax pictus]
MSLHAFEPARAAVNAPGAAALIDALDHAAALIDAEGRVMLANEGLRSLLKRALAGSSWRERITGEGLPAWDGALADALRGVPAACAVSVCDDDGAAHAVDIRLQRIDDAGAPACLLLSLREPAQQPGEDNETLRWLARATAPLTGDDFFRTLMRNLATAFGFRRAFVAECIDEPTTRVRTLAVWQDGDFRPNFELRLAGTPCERTHRDGQIYCVTEGLGDLYAWPRQNGFDSYLGAPILDTAGLHLIGHVAFMTTGPMDRAVLDSPLFQIFVSRTAAELRRKRAEDVLRASEESYRLLVEHQSEVIVKYDGERRLLFASPSFCRLFGVSEPALVGCSFRPPVAEDDRARFEQAWDALAAPPHESRFEERVSTMQGWRCLAWSQKAMLDERGHITAVVAVGRDVTERLRAEEQGRRHLQQLAHVGRISAMGEMATAIAHELNQPLTALRTYAQASQRRLAAGTDPQALTEALQGIASQAERASEIVRRLRGFLRREEMRTVPVEPNYIVREVLGLARAEAAQCGVQLTTRLADALPQVDVDCIQIEQVLLNLVRNGIEAMQQAGSVERRLVLTSALCDGEVRLSVRDSGPGVAADARDSIFEPFVSDKPSGMGIGLAISRSIAEAHRGRLWLDAESAPGALFHLALPTWQPAVRAGSQP